MTTTPDNTATTWRDLADQLTPKQRESFEYLEQTSHGQVPAHLVLGWARQAVEGNLVDMAYCDVHPPAGVISVGAWEQHREHGWSRVAVWHSYEGAVTDPRLAGTHISVDIARMAALRRQLHAQRGPLGRAGGRGAHRRAGARGGRAAPRSSRRAGQVGDAMSPEALVTAVRLPREERAEVVASLRESGLSVRAIASATGTNRETIRQEIASGDKKLSPEPDEDALADELIVAEQQLPPLPENEWMRSVGGQVVGPREHTADTARKDTP